MTGLCGVASFDPRVELDSIHACLRAESVAREYLFDVEVRRPACRLIASARSNTLALAPEERDPDQVSIVLEGWISEIQGDGPVPCDARSLHRCLVNWYRREGASFVNRLYGSFTMVLLDSVQQCIGLFADHCASRPAFWTVRDGVLIWVSDLGSLLALPNTRWTLSLPALANFLSCGHHLGESTWLEGVHRLGPGRRICWSSRGVEQRTYFEYRPGSKAEADARMDEVADQLAEAVMRSTQRCLRNSASPVVSLSGGLDSRLVLGALLEAGATHVRTTTWGCEQDYVHGDANVAARLAASFGLEHCFMKRRDDYLGLGEFTRFFGAETDAATYHIGETDILDRMLAQGWSRSLYRGDECFGWLGQVTTPAEALGAVGLRPLTGLSVGLAEVFAADAYGPLVESQHSFFETLTDSVGGGNPVDLKDRYYFEHRLARYLNPSTDYKRSRVEVFNPLLDKEILELLARMPAEWRLHKRIEEHLIQRRFARMMQLPLSSRASIYDATRRWREEPQFRAYMLASLGTEGPIWSRLFPANRIIAFATSVLDQPAVAARGLRCMAGRALRSLGLYDSYKRRSWQPLHHGQPSRMQILQRLLAMRVWLGLHEERLSVEL